MNAETPSSKPLEIWQLPELAKEYHRLVLEDFGLEPIAIGCIFNERYVFDFLIFYESLLESWTFYPFQLHAFATDREAFETVSQLGLANVQVHLLPIERSERWRLNVLQKIRLVEESGLDRCIVSDVDNVFLTETPELFAFLDQYDLVFIGSPTQRFPIQASLWAFKKNVRTIEFSRRWYERGKGRPLAEAAGLPFALLHDRPDGLAVKVLARPRPESNERLLLAPYDVQLNALPMSVPFGLSSDPLGFREVNIGRAKVIHFGGLRAVGNESLASRIDAVCDQFWLAAPFLPFYVTLAIKAAERLGMESLPTPFAYLKERLHLAGVMAHRNEFPVFLNRRGLVGRGAEIGVWRGEFSEQILKRWKGGQLISVDPWKAAPADQYRDMSNVSQEEHDSLREETQRRLAPFGERSVIWRMTSVEAAERIAPGSLDFVYVDARHDYESVKQDLECWYDKIRPGGIFAGHDYLDGDLRQGNYGVKSAVDEFFGKRELQVKETYDDRPWSSWFVEIPSDETGIDSPETPER